MKFNASQEHRSPGHPTIDVKPEALVVCLARQNAPGGYDWIAAALADLGYTASDQTVDNVLKRHGIPSVPVHN